MYTYVKGKGWVEESPLKNVLWNDGIYAICYVREVPAPHYRSVSVMGPDRPELLNERYINNAFRNMEDFRMVAVNDNQNFRYSNDIAVFRLEDLK